MFSAILLLLLAAATSVLAQSEVEFVGDSYAVAQIALWSLFFLVFIAQAFLAFVGLIICRGHRLPYIFLLLTLDTLVIGAGTLVGVIIVNNLDFSFEEPRYLFSSLVGVNAFFGNWSSVLLFVAVIFAMYDRIAACDAATGKQLPAEEIRKRRILWGAHGFLIFLTFVLGTAAAGMLASLYRDLASDRVVPSAELRRRSNTANNLTYAYSSFVIFTSFNVVALAFYLRAQLRQAKLTDRVASTLVNFVAPLYALLMLMLMIFTIIFSPAGIPNRERHAQRHANIANIIISNLIIAIMLAPIIFYGFSSMKWATPGQNNAPAFTQYVGGPAQQQPYYPQQIQYNQQPYYPPPQWPTPMQQGQPPVQGQFPPPTHGLQSHVSTPPGQEQFGTAPGLPQAQPYSHQPEVRPQQ